MANHFNLEGGFWSWIVDLNANFGALGYGIAALFVTSWALSIIIYRGSGYHRLDRTA